MSARKTFRRDAEQEKVTTPILELAKSVRRDHVSQEKQIFKALMKLELYKAEELRRKDRRRQ